MQAQETNLGYKGTKKVSDCKQRRGVSYGFLAQLSVFIADWPKTRVHRRVLLTISDVIVSAEIGVVLRQEGTEGRWHVGGRHEQALQHIGPYVALDVIEAEGGADGAVALLPAGESGHGKLRALSADGGIDGEDDATVGLLITLNSYILLGRGPTPLNS